MPTPVSNCLQSGGSLPRDIHGHKPLLVGWWTPTLLPPRQYPCLQAGSLPTASERHPCPQAAARGVVDPYPTASKMTPMPASCCSWGGILVLWQQPSPLPRHQPLSLVQVRWASYSGPCESLQPRCCPLLLTNMRGGNLLFLSDV